MLPTLEEIIALEDFTAFKTSNNKLGLGFHLNICDLETSQTEKYQQDLINLIRELPSNALSRLKFSVEKENPESRFQTKQIKFFIELGHEPFLIKELKNLFLSSQEEKNSLLALKEIHELVKASPLFQNTIKSTELKNEFPTPHTEIHKTPTHLQNLDTSIGILRLIKPHNSPLTETTLADILKHLPAPFEISVTWLKKDKTKMRLEHEKKLKQSHKKGNPTLDTIHEATYETIKNSISLGSDFLEFEFLVVLKRNSLDELRQDLKQSLLRLNQFAEFKIENYGLAPSYCATLLGNPPHVTLTEIDDVLTFFLPLWHFGEIANYNTNALELRRKDKSTFHFELFNKNYSASNTLIIGSSGKGKSVLTGLITENLLTNPQNLIMKVDVGGSYHKECLLHNGIEHKFTLHSPSGLNPFSIVNENVSDNEKVAILSRFLLVLIKEESEKEISKELKSSVEECLQLYLKKYQNPSLQEFYDFSPNFPRHQLLKRWVHGGVYQKLFNGIASRMEGKQPEIEAAPEEVQFRASGSPSPAIGAQSNLSLSELQSPSQRLQYFNFENIFNASETELAEAAIAAILAEFNKQSLCNKDKKIILICDETPFFLKSCFDFFKFTTANVRKYGHAVILISQLASDFVQNNDTGIIDNSPLRFFFSLDGTSDEIKNLFHLSDTQITSLHNLTQIPRLSSECLYQDPFGVRSITIEVSKEKYWQLTTNKEDNDKLHHLLKNVPNLKLSEAISCLSKIS